VADHVGRPEVGPRLVEVGLDGVDPVAESFGVGPATQVGQHRRGHVNRGDRGAGQVPGQGEGAGAAAGPEVDDAGPVGGLAGDPADQVAEVVVQDLGVQVEHLDQVIVGHVSTVAAHCLFGIQSCV